MDRSNHYEIGFEAYMQSLRVTCMPMDETKRSQLGPAPVKSLDFIVHGEEWKLLIDVKGRRYPSGTGPRKRYTWKCWAMAEDIPSLQRWVELFGPEYRGLLVFAYDLGPEVEVPADSEDLWVYHDKRYLFRAVPVEAYQKAMKVLSPKWRTVTLSSESFRELVRPLQFFLRVRPESGCDPSRSLSGLSLARPPSQARAPDERSPAARG